MILENNHLKVTFTPYGASIVSIYVKALKREVIYGYQDLNEYQENKDYLGCIVGRSAGRIRNATIRFNKDYPLTKNFNNHILHGGTGLHNRKFDDTKIENSILFKTHSDHLDNGFFGSIDITVKYTLEDNKLILELGATTSDVAYINMTNHVAFNLNSDKTQDILNHKLWINADKMIHLDDAFMPSKIVEVNNVFDFRNEKPIKQDLFKDDPQLQIGGGYDHPYLLNGSGLRLSSKLSVCDLTLNIYTTAPALVLYIGNFMPEGMNLVEGKSLYRGSVALETQGVPNNQEFEVYQNDNIITEDKPLTEKTIWEFQISK